MNFDDPMSIEFLQGYPIEAARVFEEIAPDDAASLLSELNFELILPVFAAMLPDSATSCLQLLKPELAAKILSELSPLQSAKIIRLLPPESEKRIAEKMTQTKLRRVYRFFDNSTISASDLMEPKVPMLPANITVADAIRRVERNAEPVACEIYVVDDAQRLLGQIEVGELLVSNHHKKLHEIMSPRPPVIAARASAQSVTTHPAWQSRYKLPVIERDNSLVGVIMYSRLQELNHDDLSRSRDNNGGIMSLFGLYWLSITQLLDSLFSMMESGKGKGL